MNKYNLLCISVFCLFIMFYLYVGLTTYNMFIASNGSYIINDMSDKTRDSCEKWYEEYSELLYIENNGMLSGSYVSQNSCTCVVVVHGYRNSKLNMLVQFKEFYDLGYDVLAIDLRGHGLSDGNCIGMGILDREDIKLWIEEVRSMNKYDNIVLYGVSMGASAILGCSDDIDVNCIIADSAYCDIKDVFLRLSSLSSFEEMFVVNALRYVTFFKAGYDLYDSDSLYHVSHSVIPILYIHGSYDDIVPISHMFYLYNFTSSSKQYYCVNENHGECFKDQYYFKTIYDFIEKYTP